MPDTCVLFHDRSAASANDPFTAEGALPLAVVLDQRNVLLCGWMSAPPPAKAEVVLGDDVARGSWQALAWSAGENAATYQFVAVLRAENIVRAQTLPLHLLCEGRPRIALPEIARVELDVAPLLEQLRAAAADLAAVADFVEEVLTGSTAVQPVSPRIRAFLVTFLGSVSVHDGFIEIVGRPDCGGLLLQGWSMHLQPGTHDVGVLAAGGIEIHEAVVGCFERADLLSTASGLVAFMKTARSVDLGALSRVYFRSNGTYYHLDVVESRITLLDDAALHLKDMLGRLHGPTTAVRALKRVCRPRFPGHETVSSIPGPVRLAQDIALHAPGGGLFVSGWLLDPRKMVNMVLLKSTGNFYARLDPTWVRLPRPDVTSGFSADPLFAEWLRPWEHQHGFIAFVPRPQPIAENEVHYLEITFEDESCAFLPIHFNDGDPQTLLRQILGAVNIDDPKIDQIIGTHLGPLVSALCSGASPATHVSTARFGCAAATSKDGSKTAVPPRASVVVPLCEGWSDFDINLARFSSDPDFEDVELIVVAPRAGGDQVAQALRRYAPFYRLAGTLVLTDEPLDYHSALNAGATVASTELLVFLSPSVFPRERGWLGALINEIENTPDAAAASPTLLYEDDSVRFAGTEAADTADGDVCDRFRGYGHHWLDGAEARPVLAGSAECCVVRKQLFFALGGFSHEFVCPDWRSRDFGLRLKATGGTFYWLPGLRLYAIDDDRSEPQDYWMRVRRLVDRLGFARKWSASTATSTVQH
jgi:GT2 family glycosyltransferase